MPNAETAGPAGMVSQPDPDAPAAAPSADPVEVTPTVEPSGIATRGTRGTRHNAPKACAVSVPGRPSSTPRTLVEQPRARWIGLAGAAISAARWEAGTR